MKYIVEEIPIYGGQIALCITENPKELLGVFDKESVEDSELLDEDDLLAETVELEYNNIRCYTIIMDTKRNNDPITHGIISHEAIHVKNLLYKTIGVDCDISNDEHEGYIISWIVDWVYKKLEGFDELKHITIK